MANSLCSLAEADAFLTDSFYGGAYGTIPAAWDDMDDGEKEQLLILAGMVMNRMTWVGWPVYEDQAMCWPRWLGNFDVSQTRYDLGLYGGFPTSWGDDNFTEETAQFPLNVKKAQAFIAYDVIFRGLQNRTSPTAGPATDAIKSINLFGDVSMSFDSGQEVPMRDLASLSALLRIRAYEIHELLAPYVAEMNFIGVWDDWEPALLDAVETS